MQHIWTIFNKTTHTWERSAIPIDEREIFRIILFTHYQFYLENSQEQKWFLTGIFLYGNVDIFLSIRRSLGMSRTIFNVIFQCKTPVDIIFKSLILNSDQLKGAFRRWNPEKNVIQHWVIKQIVNQGYLRTEYSRMYIS